MGYFYLTFDTHLKVRFRYGSTTGETLSRVRKKEVAIEYIFSPLTQGQAFVT